MLSHTTSPLETPRSNQREMTTTPTSDARGRPLHSKSKSKIIEEELEIRGRPPPRGGARASLVDHRLNRRAKIENQTAKNFPPPLHHRPLSIKSPSSCSASHLKSRPSEPQSEYVSPKALCKQSSLHPELGLKHCIAKITLPSSIAWRKYLQCDCKAEP